MKHNTRKNKPVIQLPIKLRRYRRKKFTLNRPYRNYSLAPWSWHDEWDFWITCNSFRISWTCPSVSNFLSWWYSSRKKKIWSLCLFVRKILILRWKAIPCFLPTSVIELYRNRTVQCLGGYQAKSAMQHLLYLYILNNYINKMIPIINEDIKTIAILILSFYNDIHTKQELINLQQVQVGWSCSLLRLSQKKKLSQKVFKTAARSYMTTEWMVQYLHHLCAASHRTI